MNAILFGLFGLIVGSFLNVLVLRNGVRATTGRSACMSCAREIPWFDLIPVLSWAWLRGRCRFCHGKISAQYPLVELLTALLFALVGASPLPILLRLLALPVMAILVAISAYDIRHTIIPDAWVWTFNGLALFSATLGTGDNLESIALQFLAGPFSALPLFLLWYASGGRWMGLGDAKLAIGIGWLLGPFYGITAVFFAFILGTAVTVPLIFFSSRAWKNIQGRFTQHHSWHMSGAGFTMQSEVPLGPFLIASCLFYWFLLIYNIQPFPFLWQ